MAQGRKRKSKDFLFLLPRFQAQKKPFDYRKAIFLGGRSVSNRRPPEPQSGALTN